MFTSGPDYYDYNIKASQALKAGKARLEAPDGSYYQGVVIWSGSAVRSVMPTAEALRLANQIADAIAAHKKAQN